MAEAIGLAHDLGHSPFGHSGEKVLEQICKDHNLDITFQHEMNGLRVVDKLAELDRENVAGLNLTYEVRDGIISHCGEDFESNPISPCTSKKDLENIKNRSDAKMPCTLEGCIVRFVDKITYAGRDLEDALKAKLIVEDDIPSKITDILGGNNGEILGTLLDDLIETSRKEDGKIGLSPEKFKVLKDLIQFNYEKIYLHEKVEEFKIQAEWALKVLFEYLLKILDDTKRFKNDDKLNKLNIPVIGYLKDFIDKVSYSMSDNNEIIILDFISGMTDNYVLECVNELFIPKFII